MDSTLDKTGPDIILINWDFGITWDFLNLGWFHVVARQRQIIIWSKQYYDDKRQKVFSCLHCRQQNKRSSKRVLAPKQSKTLFNSLFRNRPWFQSSCTISVKELGVPAYVAFAEISYNKAFLQILINKQESANYRVAWR